MSAKAKTKLTPQQRKATLTRVLGKIKPYSLFVVCSLVVAAVSVGAQLYIPILCGSAIDMMLGKGAVVGMMAVFGQSLLSSLRNPGYLVLAIAIWGGMYWVSKQFCKKHDIN